MRKLLALTLAMAMVLSMASVAFAAEKYDAMVNDEYVMDGDDADEGVNFGESVYFEIAYSAADADDYALLQDSEIAKKLKVKSDFTTGAEFVDSVKIVKAKIDAEDVDDCAHYFVEVALKDAPTIAKTKDVIGEITVSGSQFKFDGEKEQKIQVALSVKNLENVAMEETNDDYEIFRFNPDVDETQDEEYEIELYGDMGKFVVNTIGQDKLVIRTNVKYNEGIENADPDVNYVYFNGNNATFNKIGDLYLNAEKDNIIYKKNSDGSLTKLDVPYDEDEEAFVIRTRVIGSYVIAESELSDAALNAGVAPETEAPAAPSNPSTGAAC